MTVEEALYKFRLNLPIECTTKEYIEIRKALQDLAANRLDNYDSDGTKKVLTEIKRLDLLHPIAARIKYLK